MHDRRKLLKVKLKSLAAEARIIRLEERRARLDPPLRELLHLHRVREVRDESRLTHIAYGFIRGLAYHRIERTDRPVDWKRVAVMVRRYGVPGAEDQLTAWSRSGGAHSELVSSVAVSR